MENRYKELAEKAFRENKITELLCGTDGFSVGTAYLPANIPTDINGIFESGIYKICDSENTENIKNKISESILFLLHGSTEEIWCAYNACWAQLYFEKKGKAPFILFDDRMISTVKNCFLEHKNELSNCKNWSGVGNKDGLWGDMESSNNIFISRYGVSLL